jgi:hypothetical protein
MHSQLFSVCFILCTPSCLLCHIKEVRYSGGGGPPPTATRVRTDTDKVELDLRTGASDWLSDWREAVDLKLFQMTLSNAHVAGFLLLNQINRKLCQGVHGGKVQEAAPVHKSLFSLSMLVHALCTHCMAEPLLLFQSSCGTIIIFVISSSLNFLLFITFMSHLAFSPFPYLFSFSSFFLFTPLFCLPLSFFFVSPPHPPSWLLGQSLKFLLGWQFNQAYLILATRKY